MRAAGAAAVYKRFGCPSGPAVRARSRIVSPPETCIVAIPGSEFLARRGAKMTDEVADLFAYFPPRRSPRHGRARDGGDLPACRSGRRPGVPHLHGLGRDGGPPAAGRDGGGSGQISPVEHLRPRFSAARSRQLQEGDPRHAGVAAHRSAQLVSPYADPCARLPARQLVVPALASRLSRLVRADLPRFERRPAIRIALLGLDQGAARTQGDVRGCPQPERQRLHQGGHGVQGEIHGPCRQGRLLGHGQTARRQPRAVAAVCSVAASDLFGFHRICGSTCSKIRPGRSGSTSQTHAA